MAVTHAHHNPPDSVRVRLLVLGLALTIAPAWQLYGPEPRRVVAHQRGGQLARSGCLDPATADLEDWRTVPGISRAVGLRLQTHCRTHTCARGSPIAGVSGVGPVLSARLAKLLCASQLAARSDAVQLK